MLADSINRALFRFSAVNDSVLQKIFWLHTDRHTNKKKYNFYHISNRSDQLSENCLEFDYKTSLKLIIDAIHAR